MSTDTALRIPVQARSLRTRAAIVQAARREFEGHGYADTTARSIADAAHVGTGTFYHYFPDKDAVLREIAAERAAYWRDQLSSLARMELRTESFGVVVAEARRRLGVLVERAIAYHRKARGLHAVIAERRLSDPALDGILAASERDAVTAAAAALTAIGYGTDAEAAAFMLFSLLEGAVHAHVLGTPFVSDERFSEGLVEALFRIAVPPNRFHVTEGGATASPKL